MKDQESGMAINEDKEIYVNIVEALLFSSDTPLSVSKIREIVNELTPKEIEKAIESLNSHYQKTQRTFTIKEIAGGYQIFTLTVPWPNRQRSVSPLLKMRWKRYGV